MKNLLFWSISSKLVAILGNFFLISILSNSLSLESFGQFTALISFFNIGLFFFLFGRNFAIQKFSAEFLNQSVILYSYIYSSLCLQVRLGIFSLFFYLCCIPFYLYFFKNLSFYLFIIIGISIFFSSLLELIKSIFIGLSQLKTLFLISFLEHLGKFFLIFILLSFSIYSFNMYFLSYLLCFITTIIIIFFIFHKYIRITLNNYFFEKKIRDYSYPIFLASIGMLFVTEFDILMIYFLQNSEIAAIYSNAKRIINFLPHIALIITMVFLPKISRMNKLTLPKYILKVILLSFLFFSLICMLMAFFSQWFIPFFFGSLYTSSIFIFQILTIYAFFFLFSIVLGEILVYSGYASLRAKNIYIMILLNILLNVLLIPIYGPIGACIAAITSYIPLILINLYYIFTKIILR